MVRMNKDGTAAASLGVLLPLTLAVPALLFAAGAWWSHRQAFATAGQDLVRVSEVAREHAAKVFDTHRLVADRIGALLAGLDDAAVAADEPNLSAAMRSAIAGLPQVQAAVVTNAAGRAVIGANAMPASARLDLSGRDYFPPLQRGEVETYVSQPQVEQVTGRPFFSLARRRTGPDGSFQGVVSVAVAPDYFRNFYENLIRSGDDIEDAGKVITLVRDDGRFLVRQPPFTGPPPPIPTGGPFLATLALQPDAGLYVSRSVLDPGGPERIYAYSRVPGVPVLAVAGQSIEAIETAWRRQMAITLLVLVPTALALFLITLTASRRAGREQAALALVRHEMNRREAAEDDLRRAQRLEAVGQLTAGIAHDFNNLLTVISGNLHFLDRAGGDEARRRRHVANIQSAADRGAKLTQQLLAFARQQQLVPQLVDLNAVVGKLSGMMAASVGAMVRIETDLAPGLWATKVDPTQVELVVLNLAINARDAMPAGGQVTIGTANASLGAPSLPGDPPAGEYVVLSVRDTGTGMTPEVRARAFEPFFTTKGPGRGSGLGLSQVHGFAHQSGGGVTIGSRPGEGTLVRVFLPRTAEAVAPPADPVRADAPPTGAALILLVDDEAEVRAVAAQMLRDRGHRVLEAAGGPEALVLLAAEPDIRLAVLDYAMPGMNGLELCWRIRIRRPALPVLFVTGYSDMAALVDEPASDVLRKPFMAAELEGRVAALVRATGPGRKDPPPAPDPDRDLALAPIGMASP